MYQPLVTMRVLAVALLAGCSLAVPYYEDLVVKDTSIARHNVSTLSPSSNSYPTGAELQSIVQRLASSRRPFVLHDFRTGGGSLSSSSDPSFHPSSYIPASDSEAWDPVLLSSSGIGDSLFLDNVRYLNPPRRVFAVRSPPPLPSSVNDPDGKSNTGPPPLLGAACLGGADGSPSVGVLNGGAESKDHGGILRGVSFSDFVATGMRRASASGSPSDDAETERLYWTGDIRSTHPSLSAKADWWPSLVVYDNLGVDEVDDGVHVPMLWMSHPEVCAQPHYDRSHNLFVQLSGRKRVLLFPPAYGRFMYPYPSLHSARRMSMIPFKDEIDEFPPRLFPNSTLLKAYDVTLGPGEVLYIPPYWWHSIETLSPLPPPPSSSSSSSSSSRTPTFDGALSLSVVSPSWEEAHVSRGLWTNLPFLPTCSSSRLARLICAQVLIVNVVSRIPTLGSPSIFASFIKASRWDPLFPPSPADEASKEDPAKRDCFAGYSDVDVEQVGSGLVEALEGDIEAAAEAIADVANDDMLNTGIMVQFMAEFVEGIAAWAVGKGGAGNEGKDVPLFLGNCLDYENIDVYQEWDGSPVLEGGKDDPNRMRESSGEL